MMTIHDIAKAAQVSSATISRVLNGGSVHPKTRARVEKIIRETGYIPDSRAASLKSKDAGKVGVIVSDIQNPNYTETVKIIHNFLKEKGYPILLGCTYNEAGEEYDNLQMMRRERVSGVILCTPENPAGLLPVLEEIKRIKMPLVFMGPPVPGLDFDSVSVNNKSGVSRLAEYLIRTGRKKIAFLGSGLSGLEIMRERFAGLQDAAEKAGMRIPDEMAVFKGINSIEDGEVWGEKILLDHKPDAIVCGGDLLAVGVIKAAEKLGIKVPTETAITGFDDIYLSSLIKPKLTTVAQPVRKIAETACEILFRKIKNPDEEQPVRNLMLEPDIIIRESA